MTTEYDEKGKIFTNVLQKDPVKAIIQTGEYQIKGCIHVRRGERLKDEVDRCEKFLPVTHALVTAVGGEIQELEFLLVNLDKIIWLYPDPEAGPAEGES